MEGIKNKFKKAAKKTVKKIKGKTGQNPEPMTSKQFGDFKYKVVDGEVKITGCMSVAETVKIPAKIEGKTVAIIGKSAFKGNNAVEHVELPDCVRILGSEAFKGCSSLKYIYLPVDLETINASCFEDCVNLEEIQVPYELKKICKDAFKNCKKLRRMKHFVKWGISAVMQVRRDFEDDDLPVALEYIGEGAFEGCESLKEVNVPYLVKEISKSAFKNCTSLEKVFLHTQVEDIKDGAFSGCNSLKEIEIAADTKISGSAVFENTELTIICEKNSNAKVFAEQNGIALKLLPEELTQIDSSMIPFDKKEDYTCYYTEEQVKEIVNKCEVKPALLHTVDRETGVNLESPSRFEYRDGIYYNKNKGAEGTAVIKMTGDLMCKQNHQEAALVDGIYNFDASFKFVAENLRNSDLTIGNMETMVSHSNPYTMERMYVNDRPYLNAPDEFLTAIKKAGFDAVVNAQNHVYDAGMLGVLETLDALNRNQLMHTGVYASASDKRYLSVVINGLHIAVVAYFDGARQKMKKANFTEYGMNNVFSILEKERVIADIKAAKAEGAEFIIAYCHWGREYTEEITKRQHGFAVDVANAGADYIFGAHSHCPQPYSTIITDDGRTVPVLYSGGNFLSEIGLHAEISRNTLIGSLELIRNEEGKVVIKEDGYYPCRIMIYNDVRGKYVIVPTDRKLKVAERNQILFDSELRIDSAVGVQYKKLASREGISKRVLEKDEYILSEPMMIKISQEVEDNAPNFVQDAGSGIYVKKNNLETNEAVLMCAGQIGYDAKLGNRAKFEKFYNFRPNFELVKSCFKKADLSIGNLTSMVSTEYLSTEMMENKYNPNQDYRNARVEYLEALKYAGFDCLAMANPNNLDTGVSGLNNTNSNIENCGMFAAGIGAERGKVFDVNGIRVGILSYTAECNNQEKIITATGAEALLSVYSAGKAGREIKSLKEKGAEFVLVYANCGSETGRKNLAGRKEIAIELAESGADYVICTVPRVVSKYYKHTTADGRIVPIASSLGTFMAGRVSEENYLSALVRITLYKTPENTIEISDCYIPLKHFETLEGHNLPIVPAMPAFYSKYKVDNFKNVKTKLAKKLGDDIKLADDRVVRIGSYNKPQLTFGEIYEILGAKPDKGIDLDKKATFIATRRADLKKGCVALMTTVYSYKKGEFQIRPEDVKKSGAALAIAKEKVPGVPTIIVDNPNEIRKDIFGKIVDKYNPITVAVTGTAGKTTTKELTSCVFDTHYRSLHVVGNYNTLDTCVNVIQKLTDEDEAYIQEVHGGSPNSAKDVSELIKPDIAIITNIGDGHLLDMGTIENVIKGKLEISCGIKDTGVLIVNNDNEYMKDLQMDGKRIIHYSISDINCEYYAQNIQDLGSKTKFQVVCEHGVFDAELNIQGLHNVGNALAVFAAGMEAGIPPYKIVAGLTHYVPDADKQNLMEFNGYNMIVDTYSATPISVESAMQTLSSYPVEKGVRKIAVLGDIPALGEASVEKHKEVGERLCKYDFDLMLCIGSEAKYFAIAAQKAGKTAYAYEDREAFNRKLAESIHPGDFILFKSGTRSKLKEETIYPLFGLIDKN